jgi:hypothetical protein
MGDEGNGGAEELNADRAFWTGTVWRDEGAMHSFMRSGVHRRIMARLAEWCDEATLAHWVQPTYVI